MMDYNNITKTEEGLAAFIYDYNWDDGFDVPEKVLKEKECTLSIALLVFEMADGFTFLQAKDLNANQTWLMFINNLYKRILNREFPKGRVPYNPELNALQIHKLRKLLSDDELVFITPIE